MANLISQLRAGPAGLVLKVWEVPDEFELRPEADWAEQAAPAGPMLAMLPGAPPAR